MPGLNIVALGSKGPLDLPTAEPLALSMRWDVGSAMQAPALHFLHPVNSLLELWFYQPLTVDWHHRDAPQGRLSAKNHH